MPLQDKLDALRADLETRKLPREVVAALHRATAELMASGLAERALRAGATAPEFCLPDTRGTLSRLSDYLIRGALVLTFQRGSWCPYCSMDLQALEAASAAIRALGASLIVVTPQIEARSRKLESENALSFPILHDRGNGLAHKFGLRYRISDDLIAAYDKIGVDLRANNGEDSLTLPMPARYVIARDRVIAYAEVNPDYARRPDPLEWTPVLQRLQGSAGG